MRRTVEAEAGSIRLQRDNYKGSLLLVEGSSDKKFYDQLVDTTVCIVKSLPGKPSSKTRVISVLATLEQWEVRGILAIVDADFDNLLPTPTSTSPNLLKTDDHDLETMLIKSPALDKVLTEFCSEEKVKSFGQDIRTVILNAGLQLGYLRWISQRDELHFTFHNLSFTKFTDSKSLRIEESQLITEIKNKSQSFSLAISDLQQRIANVKTQKYDPWQICCGHDLVGVLSIGLKNLLGSNNSNDIAVPKLESCLRLAYDQGDWAKTQLYADIDQWEQTNPPFKVLAR